jgi:hypothetical protein
MVLFASLVLLVGSWSLLHGQTSALIAAIFFAILYGLFYVSKSVGIYTTLVYLILLGDIRRIIGWLLTFPTNDPLLLVGPALVLLFAIPIFIRLRMTDTNTKLIFGLMTIMILQIANPGQGGLMVGLSGALFCIPQMLWFWVGRRYGNDAMLHTVIYRILIPTAILAAAVGLYQVYFGLLPWQEAWVKHSGYTALYIGKGVRSIGFSTSSQEYADLLLMGTVSCVTGVVLGRRVLLLPLIALLPALVLASSRGAIIRLVLAVIIVWTLKSRNSATLPIRFAFVAAVTIGGMVLLLSRFGNYNAAQEGGSSASYALAHQANGLAHPLDSKYSTAGIHSAEIAGGLLAALKHPIGYGVGETNIGTKFSDIGQIVATEFDLSDEFINLGLPGGLLYLGVVGYTILLGYRYTRIGPRSLSLPVFAMLFAMLGDWLFPGEYGNGPVFWIMIGCTTAAVHRLEQALPSAGKASVTKQQQHTAVAARNRLIPG